MAGYGPASGNGAKPVLLLMDSPRKQDGQRAPWSTATDERDQDSAASSRKLSAGALQKALLVGGASHDVMRLATQMTANPPESLGRLLVEVTAQVQDERSRRSDVEKKNQSLMLEIEQLQRELLALKTTREQQSRRRASGDWDAATRADIDALAMPPARDGDTDAELWRRELQDARRAKDAALADAHRLALEVLELQACISMQHDELRSLRASDADVRGTLTQAEDGAKELRAQHTILAQENQLLKDEVAHLNGEIGKRGSHFKALLDKWTESQAQCEHVERENRAMLNKMKDLRARHEQLQRETLLARDERDALQHQAHHLKGAVAAKAAEAKAFQAYGSNARDHLQVQQAAIQRHAIYRRQVHHVARDSALLVAGIKATLAAVRAPLVAIQHDFRTFLRHLQAPVMSLVTRSRRFAELAHIEHTPLRAALAHAELARRHLHEQLWRARRNALLVCQIRNLPVTTPSGSTADAILSGGDLAALGTPAPPPKRALRANYATGELLLRESERDTVTVKCDAVFSDRARGGGCWNHHESVAPLLQSVLDGFNGCVATFDGLPPLKLGAEDATVGVPELVLSQLFALLHHGGAHLHRVKLTISFLGVYNEAIFDLLGLDATNAAAAAPSMGKIVVLEVQNAEEALLVLRGGGENLDAAHDAGLLDKFLTHKVITVCVAHKNLLLSTAASASTKSKLQIVELATGAPRLEGDTTTPDAGWEDRSRVKAQVAMENGVQALLTALADVRVAADASGGGGAGALISGSGSASSGAFVRYHSSKLTVLLQDTVKASAKFVGIAALPGAASSGPPGATSQLDERAAQATRWLFHIRNAVGSATASGGPTGTHGSSDRSVEGFINRLTSHQYHADGPGAKPSAGLAFASSEMVDRPPLVADVDPRRWEKELERMNRRYGDLNKFTTTFYQPGEGNGASTIRRRRSCDDDDDGFQSTGTLSPRRPTSTVTCVEQLTDVVIRPEELVSLDDGTDGAQPPPAPVNKTSRSKSKPGSKVYRGVPGHRNGPKSHARATLSGSATDKSKRRVTVSAMVAATGSRDTTSMATTLAPSATGPQRATSIVKMRRETASSALKKALVGASAPKQRPHAASASYHHASSLTSGPAPVLTAASTMTATAATQARLQNRKIPFK